MTNEQAITKLKGMYADVRNVEPGVFAGRENGKITLYRLNDGILEQRVDYDVHTCGWEEVE